MARQATPETAVRDGRFATHTRQARHNPQPVGTTPRRQRLSPPVARSARKPCSASIACAREHNVGGDRAAGGSALQHPQHRAAEAEDARVSAPPGDRNRAGQQNNTDRDLELVTVDGQATPVADLIYNATTGQLETITMPDGNISLGYSPTTGQLTTLSSGADPISRTSDGASVLRESGKSDQLQSTSSKLAAQSCARSIRRSGR